MRQWVSTVTTRFAPTVQGDEGRKAYEEEAACEDLYTLRAPVLSLRDYDYEMNPSPEKTTLRPSSDLLAQP